MWTAVQESCKSRYFSEADWARLRLELHFANETLRKPTGSAWQQVQRGLTAMLISPAEKRRCAIELRPPDDSDEVAAVPMLAQYRQSLKPV
jgi:hypothetical protein